MSRIFYGWIVVFGCFFCCFNYGAFYTLGVFFTALEAEFGWSATLVSSIHSLHLLAFLCSTLITGWFTDRWGPRWPVLAGTMLVSTGFCLLSQVHSLSQFFLFYILASLGAGISWSLPTATVQRWFIRHSGLALGIVVAGFGLGTMVYSPVVSYLISTFGWRITYLWIGIFNGLSLFLSFLVIDTPQKKGILPLGVAQAAGEIDPRRENGWQVEKAVRTPTFIMICLFQFCMVMPIHILATHLVRFAELSGIEKSVSAGAWGLVGGVSILGRIFVPVLAQRMLGWTRTMAVCAFIAGAAYFWLIKVDSVWMLYAFVLVYGFSYGGIVPLAPGTTRFFFGAKILGQLIGICFALSHLGGIFGPMIAGYLVDTHGNYNLVFFMGALFWITAGTLALFIKPPVGGKSVQEYPEKKDILLNR